MNNWLDALFGYHVNFTNSVLHFMHFERDKEMGKDKQAREKE